MSSTGFEFTAFEALIRVSPNCADGPLKVPMFRNVYLPVVVIIAIILGTAPVYGVVNCSQVEAPFLKPLDTFSSLWFCPRSNFWDLSPRRKLRTIFYCFRMMYFISHSIAQSHFKKINRFRMIVWKIFPSPTMTVSI